MNTQLIIQKRIKKYNFISFCFICNYVNKISSYIKTLCIDINFKLDYINNKTDIIQYLKKIIKNEKLTINDDLLEKIYLNSKCDIRMMINMLINKNYIKQKEITDPKKILEIADIKNNIYNNNCTFNIQKYRMYKFNKVE